MNTIEETKEIILPSTDSDAPVESELQLSAGSHVCADCEETGDELAVKSAPLVQAEEADDVEDGESPKTEVGSLPDVAEDEKVEEIEQSKLERRVVNAAPLDVEIEDISEQSFVDVKKNTACSLDDYRKMQEDGTVFSVEFSSIDRRSSLFAFTGNGICLKMTGKNIDGFQHSVKNTSRKLQEEMLGRTYNVIVVGVVEEENIVYVSAHGVDKVRRQKVRELLEKGVEEEKYKVVKAKVVRIAKSKGEISKELLILDVGCLGITGFMRLKEWGMAYTESFRGVVSEGDVIKVAVLRSEEWDHTNGLVYECSRRALIKNDPWDKIDKIIHVKDYVRVRCVKREKEYFFGRILGLDDIDVICYYPDDRSVEVETNGVYLGIVRKLDKSKRSLRVRIPKETE